MKVSLPQYSGRDNLVMAITLLPYAIILNAIMFEGAYFKSFGVFIGATLITLVASVGDFVLCGVIAVSLKKKFPAEQDLMKRLAHMILSFLALSGFFLYTLYHGYELIPWFKFRFIETNFVWAYFALGIINIFLTFLMEGISQYKEWQQSFEENKALSQVYKQSQLQGLKSQVNPHFLFNSLNSLSSLIQEDEEGAEIFLDEMSKVYRYMLRNDEEQLVPLETELKFIASYRHLLQARYGSGLQLQIDVEERDKKGCLAPLTLQVIIENAFSQNILSKTSPLIITIISDGDGNLVVRYNVQPKMISDVVDFEAGLDNLVKKYELLNIPILVHETQDKLRVTEIPLIFSNKEAVT